MRAKLENTLKKIIPRGRSIVIAIPFAWMILFFLIPFAFVLKISFAELQLAIPPFTALTKLIEESLHIKLNLGNYLFLLQDPLYINAYISSVKFAFVSTMLCLLIGYPMAYAISKSSPNIRNILLMLIVLPSWTEFLIRIYAWIGILKNNGILNNFLLWLGVIDEPLVILNTNIAVYIGIVYGYLPFMILPLYTNLTKHDDTLLEAAYDLGCPPWKSFLTITLPLSFAGIVAGCMLVFIPAVGEFVIPELLGGSETLMIGKVLWQEFFNNRDWPVASAVAIIMLIILAVPLAIFHHFQAKETL